MKQVSGNALAKAIERKGWSLVRIKPIHGNRPLKIGLLRALMKIAELEESDV